MKAICSIILCCLLITKFASAQTQTIKATAPSYFNAMQKENWKLPIIQNSNYNNLAQRKNIAPAKKTTAMVRNAFAKGKWMMPFQTNLSYSHYTYEANNVELGKQNNFRINLEGDYFIQNNIAIGLDLRGKWSGQHYANDNLSRSWDAMARVLYGKPLNDNFYLYGQAFVGYGMDKQITETPTTTFKDKSHNFCYGLTVGAPIRLVNSNVFLNPTLTYEREKINFDDGEETANNIKFGLHLVSFMDCDEYTCDSKSKYTVSKDRYQQGRSFIDYTSKLRYEFGGYNSEV